MCGDIIDTTEAALENAPEGIAAAPAEAGYVPGVAAPAVYWANSCCVSLGVHLIHGTLSGLLDVTGGVDWVVDIRQQRWLKINHEYNEACLYCAPEGDPSFTRQPGRFRKLQHRLMSVDGKGQQEGS